uniref:Uncharacterized protein n=1 Tax=Anguilla anguilla TaxID=7936 RepID=A0A0E9VA11_ANGAN
MGTQDLGWCILRSKLAFGHIIA